MKILAIDTSSNVASVALLEDEKLIGEYTLNHKKTHSQKIMPMIDDLLKSCEVDVLDIDVFAAANGPGSFTGLRIGVSTIKALAHAANKPLVGISTLEGLAFNIPYSSYLLCPIMDARREQVYNGVYKWEEKYLKQIISPRAISLEECINEVKNEKVIFLGDGVPVHQEKISEMMKDNAIFAPAPYLNQRASSIAQLAYYKANRGELENYLEFAPIYLRKSQAEREYEEKQKQGENLC